MTAYIAKRLLLALLTVFLASVLIFWALQMLPGDVARQILGRDATEQAIAALNSQLGLERPPWERYCNWLFGALQGDFGTSLVNGQPAADLVFGRLRNTMLIAGIVIVVGITLTVVLGVLAGLNRGKFTDNAISTISLVGMSVPEYTIATLLVLLFTIAIPIFPAVVTAGPTATVAELMPVVWLPAITLTIVLAAYIVRMMRSSVIDVMSSEFVLTAQLKGVKKGRLVMKHVLPSSLLPVLNVIAMNIAWLIGGVVVVETIFNYPGLGTLMLDSVSKRDLPVLQLIGIVAAVVYALANLAADVLGLVFNPRLRLPRNGGR